MYLNNKIMIFYKFILLLIVGITSLASTTWWKLGSGQYTFLRRTSYMMLGANNIENSYAPCKNLTVLSPTQINYCRRYVDHMPSVSRGAEIGINECKRQFKDNRWNCTSVKEIASDFGVLPDTASRESAFTHAVSSAGVVYTIGQDCKQGKLKNCGCSQKGRPKNLNMEWHWGGCGDNIEYGYRFACLAVYEVKKRSRSPSFAKGFVDSPELEKNFPRHSTELAKTLMNLHNNEAGRLELKRNPKTACKCHGVSGACTVTTCWTQLKKFRVAGQKLRRNYNKAIKVKFNKRGTKLVNSFNGGRIKKRQLVYIDKSPSYCELDILTGSMGTMGRQCRTDIRAVAVSSCKSLCCGRGYRKYRKIIKTRCNCKFKWCCSVRCDTCSKNVVVNRCK